MFVRFISRDTYEGEINNPLSQNLYTYVHNNPLLWIDPTGYWCTSADDRWSHPGGCNGGVDGIEVFGDVGTSKYIDDSISINFGRTIIENGVAQGKWYPEGAFRIEGDPTGITDAFIGCFYDSQCGGFVLGGLAQAPAIYNGMKSSVSNGISWVEGLLGARNVAKIGDEIGNLGTFGKKQ